MDDQRDVSYDVTCEISMAVCESTPDSLCDAVTNSEVIFSDDDRRALSFEDAFDGEIKVQPRRLVSCLPGGRVWDKNYDDDNNQHHHYMTTTNRAGKYYTIITTHYC